MNRRQRRRQQKIDNFFILAVILFAVFGSFFPEIKTHIQNVEISNQQQIEQAEKEGKTTNQRVNANYESGDSATYRTVHHNDPGFSEKQLQNARKSYKKFSDLDSLGRCGTAEASVGRDLLPTEKRQSIGMIRPTGWHTVRYDNLIEDRYLYNRCHLIAFCLCGENANEKNLITGTRYMNVEGMLPFETKVLDYVRDTGNHVLYQVAPDFKGDNLLASGVRMKAESVEDNGKGIKFNVYVNNVQPGILIDYKTGDSKAEK